MLIATATAASFDYDRQMHELLEINANFNWQRNRIESVRIGLHWTGLSFAVMKALTEHVKMLFSSNIIWLILLICISIVSKCQRIS